jgi:hypothetical protein
MTKQLLTKLLTCLALTVLLSSAYGGIPGINVIVSDASGKVAFKGVTQSDATFATSSLPPGEYVVQFGSTNAALKGNQYLLVVSAGKKKVIADAVAGEQFAGGGIAIKVNVGAGLRITGQVAPEQSAIAQGYTKVRVVSGKRYVWVPGRVGTNFGPHWELETLGPAQNLTFITNDTMRKMQDRAFEGSMLDRYNTGSPAQVSVHGSGGY